MPFADDSQSTSPAATARPSTARLNCERPAKLIEGGVVSAAGVVVIVGVTSSCLDDDDAAAVPDDLDGDAVVVKVVLEYDTAMLPPA